MPEAMLAPGLGMPAACLWLLTVMCVSQSDMPDRTVRPMIPASPQWSTNP